jgi:hypothetical protein
MTINIQATEFPSALEALQYSDSAGGKAIWLAARYFVVSQEEADRIAAAGICFAYLGDHAMPDGSFRIMTVPVN